MAASIATSTPLPAGGDGPGVDAATEAAIAAAAVRLDGLIDGPRHVEAFAVVA